MTSFLIATLWLLCSIYTTGTTYALFQGEHPDQAKEDWRTDLGLSILLGLFGPAAALIVFLISGFNQYGWGWYIIPLREKKIAEVSHKLDRI